MASCNGVARPLVRSLRYEGLVRAAQQQSATRCFSAGPSRRDEQVAATKANTSETKAAPALPASTSTSNPPASAPSPSTSTTTISMRQRLMDPETTTAHWAERKLLRRGTPPVGSRRRRAAIRTSENVPFEELPYQCFQEARKVLHEDRLEKLEVITKEMRRVTLLENTPADQVKGGQARKDMRLKSLRQQVEKYKILADINDPTVKRRFEDGFGDMNKPIYRHLAEKKWRGYPFRQITQRISQLNIVPDVLPKFEPTMDVQLHFRRVKIEPGAIVDSRISEVPPRLRVQSFQGGQRLVSVVVMDSDVPNPETDSFDRRCHYLAANIPLSPAEQSMPLGQANKDTQLAVPWLPAFSQKGAPYHRLSIFILEQKDNQTLDTAKLRELYQGRDGFSLKSYRDKFNLNPIGFNIFRTVWDEGTAGVMERAGMPGADLEFKLKRVYSMKPEKKLRGWEAKRQKPKYRGLWKYSKRIHGMSIGRRSRG